QPQPGPQPEPAAGTAQPRPVEPAEAPDNSPVAAATRTSKKAATGGDGNRSRDDVHAQSRRKSQPIAGIRPWARCFTEGLRPVQPPTAATPTRTWRVFSSARDQRLANLGRQFTADPSAQRTLAIIEDPADELSRTTALAAAQDAVGRGELVVLTTSAAFASFFATLHAEHPSMGVTVLRVSSETASLAAVLPFAIATPGRFRELVVTGDGEVSEPVLAEVPVPGGGGLPLGPDDTIVISRETGGAGLVLAQVLSCAGTKVVVAGQAEAGHDTRLIAGLEELRAAGARIAYEAIDISDAASLADAMSRIEDRLGPVTAIAHGVSQGDPVPVIKITNEDINSLPASPAGTLQRLVESVGAGQLKLLISVGTVAGRYGLPGAGVHTLDRGALASRAAEIAAAQPDCQHVHLDQPAWTARGLGERPKLVNQLAAADTPPIGLAAASRLLLRAFTTPGRPASIAVHGRVGGLARRPAPTISSEELAAAGMPKGGRFLRQVAVHYPGIELICAARISLASDPYLADYRIDGLPVLPPVLALEALAQAASVLAGRPVRQAMSVRFDTPAVIPEDGAAMLRVCAQRDGDTVIAVLRCSQSSYRVDHAAATFSCEQAGMPDSPVAVGSSAVPPLVSAAATGLVDGA
ncbi:MAG: polyketide synthase dehydratase domain-containing protein, partial [Actinobacteria bacterium]|nr:polyketide synthase dehydratase domain-containing protein [Actinomycetota bacterium]